VKQIFKGGVAWSAGRELFEGVLVEDGRIIAIGPGALTAESDEVIDLAGGFLMPGFGDGHAHPIIAGREARGPKITGMKDLKLILQEVKKYADANPSEPWIIGGAYEAALIDGGDFLASWLDEYVSDRPVVLHAVDHHTIWVNSRALEVAGITSGTMDPAGGTIARTNDGSPKGTLREPSAISLVLDKAPNHTVQSDLQAIKYACNQYLKFGVTNATECWVEAPMGEAYIEAAKTGVLTIDMNLMQLADPKQWREQSPYFQSIRAQVETLNSPKLAAKTIKFLTDGALSSGTAALLEPYLDDPTTSGLKIWDDENLLEALTHFDSLNFQVHIHAIGDAAVRQSLDAIESMTKANPKWDRRPTIVHAQLISKADLPRFAKLGVIANFQPLWTYLDPMNKELILPRIGEQRNNAQYQLCDVLDSGARIAFGSDWPVTSADPIEALFVPVNRKVSSVDTGPAWSPEQGITIAQSLKSFTSEVAYQNFRENEIGKLEVGMRANFVVLDKNPFETGVVQISNIYLDGACVK